MVETQVNQEGVTCGNPKIFPAFCVVCVGETVEIRTQILDRLDGPGFGQVSSVQCGQSRIAAGFGKNNAVELSDFVVIQEFIIDADIDVIRLYRKNAGDVCGNRSGSAVAEHGNPFIALKDIETVEIFKTLDRVVDSLGLLGVVEGGPLLTEFGVVSQSRQKVPGKSILPAFCYGAGNHADGDVLDSYGYLRQCHVIGKKTVQRGQIRISSLAGCFPERLVSLLFCLYIILSHLLFLLPDGFL